MPVNRSLSPLRSYGRNFVAMPLVLRGNGVGAGEMEVVSGPPGCQVAGPSFGEYTVTLPGEGRFTHISATGNPSRWGGSNCFIDSMDFQPTVRSFSFRVADYSGGAPVVLSAGPGDIACFSVFVDNK